MFTVKAGLKCLTYEMFCSLPAYNYKPKLVYVRMQDEDRFTCSALCFETDA